MRGKPHLEPRRGESSRHSRSFAIAVALHVVVGAVVVQVLTFGHGLPAWMRFGGGERPTEERLTYVTPREQPRPVRPQASTETRRVAPSTAPTLPSSAPQAPMPTPAATAPRDTGSGIGVGQGAGNGVGEVDPNLRGVKPTYTDGRVWRGPVGGGAGDGIRRGDRADNLDSIMAWAIMAAGDSLDSLARAQGKYGRAPGDWTKKGKNGEKWGWDQQGIRLGKVTIPNALLALLPLNAATAANMSGNMSRMDADRRLGAARADIARMSERGLGEAEFRKVVNMMNARRDVERRERLRAPSASVAAPVKTPDKSSDRR
jgi:hypothetical protein